MAADAQPAAAPAAQTRLIAVGGRRVAFHVTPGRLPAVVFEAGGGMDGSAWDPVLAAIYADTGSELVPPFDRAGLGDSDEETRPVQLQHEVDDLKAALSALGTELGIVFGAHSFGGEVATAFAAECPGILASAVLVDASLPSFLTDEVTARIVATFPKNVEQTDKQGHTMVAFFAACRSTDLRQ